MPTQKDFYLSYHEQRVNGIPHTRPGAATDPLHLELGAGKAEQRLRDCEYPSDGVYSTTARSDSKH